MDDRAEYRAVIDALVRACKHGQGQIGARRARVGLWNPNADGVASALPDQGAINDLLRRLSQDDREVLAGMLSHEFEGGVHETLVVLHERTIPPFDRGYEGTPFHDFIGRLDGWDWPS